MRKSNLLGRRWLNILTSWPLFLAAQFAGGAERPPPVTPQILVTQVADAVRRDFPNPPPFDWGEGVLMSGMMRASRLTRDERYLHFVQQFADHWQQQGISPILNRKGYCGHWGPGYSVVLLYEETRNERYRKLAEEVNSFIMTKAGRTQAGALNHFFTPPELWVDTLFMCCPGLSHGARLMNTPQWQEESVRQIELFAQQLQDPETGLFYHMWNEPENRRTTNFWARGNGWVAMSCVEALKFEKAGSARRKRLEEIFKKQLAGIMARQDPETGLWHTILEAPETYLETSASAMFLYAIAECRKAGLLDLPYGDAARKTWAGLRTKVDAQGRVTGVSAGTGPTPKARYTTIPQGTFTWGTGAFLMAACAYAESGLAK